jgi:transposase
MFDAEASQLRHALRTADRSGVGRGYPKPLRERVVVYAQRAVAAGRPRADVAEALGLAPVTLARWGRPRRAAAPGFRPVVVAAEPARAAPAGGVAVVLPGGVRVEGLSVEQAAELCRRLR